MKCPSCGSINADTAKSCNLCGKVLLEPVGVPPDGRDKLRDLRPKGVPLGTGSYPEQSEGKETLNDDKLAELRREYAVKEAERERKSKEYRRYKMRDHGITGIITFFILNLLIGLPGSLFPLQLLLNAVLSAIFGFPVGYLISRWGGGIGRGVLISSGFFALLLLVTSAPSFFSGNITWNVFGLWIGITLLKGLILGIIPGAIIGYHVHLSQS